MDSSIWSNLLSGVIKGYKQAKQQKEENARKSKPTINDAIKAALWKQYQAGDTSPNVLEGLGMYVSPEKKNTQNKKTNAQNSLKNIISAISGVKTLGKTIPEATGWQKFLSIFDIPSAREKVSESNKAKENVGKISNLLLQKLQGLLQNNGVQNNQTNPVVNPAVSPVANSATNQAGGQYHIGQKIPTPKGIVVVTGFDQDGMPIVQLTNQ